MKSICIAATDDSVEVVILHEDNNTEHFFFNPGWITGADLQKILEALDIQADYKYEGD